MLKRVLVWGLPLMLLVHCTDEKPLPYQSQIKPSNLRTTASVLPAQIFTIEKPLLHSSDQISISESDQTIVCELGGLNLTESAEGINFVCGYQQPANQSKKIVFPPALGLGKVWMTNSKAPTHLWINGVLHFCRTSKKSTLQCFTNPVKENNS